LELYAKIPNSTSAAGLVLQFIDALGGIGFGEIGAESLRALNRLAELS
jgi:hypothetical protein